MSVACRWGGGEDTILGMLRMGEGDLVVVS